MSLHDDFEDVVGLAKTVLSDRKAEKEREQHERQMVQLVCPYCGSSNRFFWEEGKLPGCPNCGAVFDAEDSQLKKLRELHESKAETWHKAQETAAIESARTKSKIRRYIIIGMIVLIALIAIVVIAKLYGGNLHLEGGGNFEFHIS